MKSSPEDSKTKSKSAQNAIPQTAAPWAKSASTLDPAKAAPPARPGLTGRPVQPLVQAEAQLPRNTSASSNGLQFKRPIATINSQADLHLFLQSDTIKSFVGFIMAANEAVRGVKDTAACQTGPALQGLIKTLDTLSGWVDEIPPAQQSLRYGNPAFKTWYAKMFEASDDFIEQLLPPDMRPAVMELSPYFQNSFGNVTRLDYGTGHETTFIAFLYCLAALNVINKEDLIAVVTKVFTKYVDLMRKLQTTYWLEPAGSHGVWGLDDYQFVPFIWGSSQLIGHQTLKPGSIHAAQEKGSEEYFVQALDSNAEDYQYFKAVQFVKKVKKGPLQETSPLLNDISGVPTWEKVNEGMLKMYQVEVLSKLPIMQHFLFGSLITFPLRS